MNRLHNPTIRRFQASDLVPVWRLIHETIDACYTAAYPARAVEFFKGFHSEDKILARQRDGAIFLAERDGKVIATGSIVGSDIFGVFVHPDFQHRGLGGLLMRELENQAKADGFAELELSVSLPSKGFYENLGYEILEACSIDVGDGQLLSYWKARKLLTRH